MCESLGVRRRRRRGRVRRAYLPVPPPCRPSCRSCGSPGRALVLPSVTNPGVEVRPSRSPALALGWSRVRFGQHSPSRALRHSGAVLDTRTVSTYKHSARIGHSTPCRTAIPSRGWAATPHGQRSLSASSEPQLQPWATRLGRGSGLSRKGAEQGVCRGGRWFLRLLSRWQVVDDGDRARQA